MTMDGEIIESQLQLCLIWSRRHQNDRKNQVTTLSHVPFVAAAGRPGICFMLVTRHVDDDASEQQQI